MKFKFLSESRFTSACEIRQNVQWLRYRDITVFIMAVPHHLNFRNFSFYSRDLCLCVILLSCSKFCINRTLYSAGIYPKVYSLYGVRSPSPSVVDALEFMPCLFFFGRPRNLFATNQQLHCCSCIFIIIQQGGRIADRSR